MKNMQEIHAREAEARAAGRLGAEERCRTALATACELAAEVENEEERALLKADLKELERPPAF